MIDRKAEVRWEGELKGGNGKIRLGSGAFEGKYSFGTRFEGAPGTNPEELLGAAHAGCFSMALAAALGKAGHSPQHIDTSATVVLEKTGDGFSISRIRLRTRGAVPGLDEPAFRRFAEDAKQNCIVSRALASVPMELDAALAT